MHMRKKKWSRPELAACPWYVDDPSSMKGRWRAGFPHPEHPFDVELGCGKGVSTARMVRAERDRDFLAIDISPDVLGCALRNIRAAFGEEPVENAMLTRCDIEHISSFLAPEDAVDRVIISFCNPWDARPRQHRRRLTHPRQLMQYREFLKDGGLILFKTDDEQLYRDSLKYLEACGFAIDFRTEDLHQSGWSPNYISEHERKFTAQGIPIRMCCARKLPGQPTLTELQKQIWHMDEDDADEDDGTEGEGAGEE